MFANHSISRLLGCRPHEVFDTVMSLPNQYFLQKKQKASTDGVFPRPKLRSLYTRDEKSDRHFSSDGQDAKQLQEVIPEEEKNQENDAVLNLSSSNLPSTDRTTKSHNISPQPSLFQRTSEQGDSNPKRLFTQDTKKQTMKTLGTYSLDPESQKDFSMATHFWTTDRASQERKEVPVWSNASPRQSTKPEKQFKKLQSYEISAEKQMQEYQSKTVEFVFDDDVFHKKITKYQNVEETVEACLSRSNLFIKKMDSSPPDDVKAETQQKVKRSRTIKSPISDSDVIVDLLDSSALALRLQSFIKHPKSSKTASLEVSIIPVLRHKRFCLVILVNDRTDRDMARRFKQMDHYKTSSLASITHEFRAPLSGIMSMLELLNDRVSDELKKAVPTACYR